MHDIDFGIKSGSIQNQMINIQLVLAFWIYNLTDINTLTADPIFLKGKSTMMCIQMAVKGLINWETLVYIMPKLH